MLEKSYKHVSCETCGARKSSLFGSLCKHEVSHTDEVKVCSYYKKQQSIFIEGSMPSGVFCLNQGKVKIFTRGDEGKEQIVHIAKEGEIIGFRSMFSEEPYRVNATALEESNICFIKKEHFVRLIDNNPTLRSKIIKELSKELADRAVFITNMAQKSVRERLAFSLLLLEDIYGEEPINLSREDMANFVGTATETLIRLLRDFKEEGLIVVNTRKILLSDRKTLEQIAGR